MAVGRADGTTRISVGPISLIWFPLMTTVCPAESGCRAVDFIQVSHAMGPRTATNASRPYRHGAMFANGRRA
jgi:hypothetical protein